MGVWTNASDQRSDIAILRKSEQCWPVAPHRPAISDRSSSRSRCITHPKHKQDVCRCHYLSSEHISLGCCKLLHGTLEPLQRLYKETLKVGAAPEINLQRGCANLQHGAYRLKER